MKVGIPLSWRNIKERYNLIGSHCEACNSDYFPMRKICPKCRRKGKIIEKKFDGNGTIESYTIVYAPPTGFSLKAPYALALIKIENGPMVMGMVEDIDFNNEEEKNKLKIGAKVESTYRKWLDEEDGGLIHYGFAFRLVDLD